MATVVHVTTTPKRQGTITVKHYDTLTEARGTIFAISDRNLTADEMQAWRKQVK